MEKILKGKIFKLGKNIDTDQIYPGRFVELTDIEDVAKHCLAGVDENFAKKIKQGDMIVASTNFGCGSSREHAAITLKAAGISAVIAESFARIFFRNAINLGLPLITCPGITDKVKENEVLIVNTDTGEIKNDRGELVATAEPLSEYMMNILENGGIKPMLAAQFAK